MSDFIQTGRPLLGINDPDPAVQAARRARADRAQAQALAAQERLHHQREKQVRSAQLLDMLAAIAVDPNVPHELRIKAAGQYLDRTMPRLKSTELQVDGVMQVQHQVGYQTASERVLQMSFDQVLADYQARILEHQQRAQPGFEQVFEQRVIEHQGVSDEQQD